MFSGICGAGHVMAKVTQSNPLCRCRRLSLVLRALQPSSPSLTRWLAGISAAVVALPTAQRKGQTGMQTAGGRGGVELLLAKGNDLMCADKVDTSEKQSL